VDYIDNQIKSAQQREGREIELRQVFIERKPAVLITTLTTTPDFLFIMRRLGRLS